MGEETFDGKLLAEKLSKLNSSQQSIESLSRRCISFRKKAKHIVETWDKLFKSAQPEQCVSFLYLANDIIQNSRRKGSEFVNEFWKVLPSALKHVYESGDEQGKKVATRLVDIWEERKLFGSRGQILKDGILGKNPSSAVSNGESSNPIKVVKKEANPIRVVKRDAHSLRIKLAVGGLPEKIISTFHLVHDENINEEAAINKYEGAISCVGEMEKDVENFSNQGNIQGSELVDKIQEQEEILRQCVIQLENAEATRMALVTHLKEALQDQEAKLEQLSSKLQVARSQREQATNMRQRLTSPTLHTLPTSNVVQTETVRAVESNLHPTQLNAPLTSFASPKLSDEESTRAAAAAVVAKLAASTSSAQMLTSVFSSLVAEEAASMSNGLKSTGFLSGSPFTPPEKRPKLEKPMQLSETNNPEGGNSNYFMASQQQPPSMGMHPYTQGNQIQAPFPSLPPPPMPANTPANQLVQSSAMMMGVLPYGYGGNNMPPPPFATHMAMGFANSAPPPQQQPAQQLQTQQPQSQQPQHQQQQQGNGNYYRPPGIGFYGQSHQTATPPVPRQ